MNEKKEMESSLMGQIRISLDSNRLDEAFEMATELLKSESGSAELHFLLGQIFRKKEEWGNAINHFQRVLELDPEFPGAQNHIRLVQSILGFYNPDLMNP